MNTLHIIDYEWPPRELMRMVASHLTANWFAVHTDESDDESRRLTITGLTGLRCRLRVEDCGTIECEYGPQRGWAADPVRVAGLVADQLTGGDHPQLPGRTVAPGLPPRTFIGRELKAAGLDVSLAVYPDLADFNVLSDLVVTNPAHPERGEICIADDGGVTVEFDCRTRTASPIGIEEAAGSIARDVTYAVAGFNAAISQPINQNSLLSETKEL